MPSFFYESRPGVFDSPFAGGLDAPKFAEPKARLMEHFESGDELNEFLQDADAVTGAMRDYVWSLPGVSELRGRFSRHPKQILPGAIYVNDNECRTK